MQAPNQLIVKWKAKGAQVNYCQAKKNNKEAKIQAPFFFFERKANYTRLSQCNVKKTKI